MSWKDFFYFSKGERRALTLLLFIIALTLLLLVLKDYYIPYPQKPQASETIAQSYPGNPVVYKTETKKDSILPTKPEKERVNQTEPPKAKYTPKPRFTKSGSTFSQKFPKGTIVELNSADTTILKKVPGIGSAFANRIIKYRELLGGYAYVEQLQEVYGIDEEKYIALVPWFDTDTANLQKLAINHLPVETIARHPYLNYKQARAIVGLRERKGRLSGWLNLQLLEEFSETDIIRLNPYFSFE